MRFSLLRPFLHLPPACIVAAIILTASAGMRAHAQVDTDPHQRSIALLRQATQVQRDGSHLPLLYALRQLRDPDLKSLFLQLAQRGVKEGEWPIQVHAVLGLAEIDPDQQVDPWLITKVEAQAQEAIIAAALDAELMPDAVMKELLQWDQLHPMARLFLLAEQVSLKQPADVEELARLSKSDDTHAAGLASALLAQLGRTEAFSAYLGMHPGLSTAQRNAVVNWLIDGARRYKLTALIEWINSIATQSDVDSDILSRAAIALLTLDPPRGIAAWTRALGTAPSFPHRVRCGIMLLSAREHAPASAYDKLLPAGEDEELIAHIAALGKAISAKSDPADAMIDLLGIGHTRSGMWVMEYLKEIPPEQSRRVYEYLIDRMSNPSPYWSEAVAQAVESTGRLYKIDRQAVLTRLAAVPDDGAQQQAILLGLLESGAPGSLTTITQLPRIGSGRADSLALLLIARHSSSLTPDDLRHLGMIAAGGGRVSESLQVQAAWLYLKRTGKLEQAVAAVFAGNQ